MTDYNQFENIPPSAEEFKKELEKICAETGSHGKPVIMVKCENDEADYEVVGMGVDLRPGCGCWDNPIIVIRKTGGGNEIPKKE